MYPPQLVSLSKPLHVTVCIPHMCVEHKCTHMHTHRCTHAWLTVCWDCMQHLLYQLLHVWKSFDCNGHLTELPQSLHTAVVLQVVVQELSTVIVSGGWDATCNVFSDHVFTHQFEQVALRIHNLEKFIFIFLKDLRHWGKQVRMASGKAKWTYLWNRVWSKYSVGLSGGDWFIKVHTTNK